MSDLHEALVAEMIGVESAIQQAMDRAQKVTRTLAAAVSLDRGGEGLQEAAQKVVAAFDRTHLQHDVAYEDFADTFAVLRAALVNDEKAR